jgi:hypothetical protein
MGELADALRANGHDEIAAALERKELAGRLRQAGRDDLADALLTGENKLTSEEERELDRINREVGVSAPASGGGLT